MYTPPMGAPSSSQQYREECSTPHNEMTNFLTNPREIRLIQPISPPLFEELFEALQKCEQIWHRENAVILKKGTFKDKKQFLNILRGIEPSSTTELAVQKMVNGIDLLSEISACIDLSTDKTAKKTVNALMDKAISTYRDIKRVDAPWFALSVKNFKVSVRSGGFEIFESMCYCVFEKNAWKSIATNSHPSDGVRIPLVVPLNNIRTRVFIHEGGDIVRERALYIQMAKLDQFGKKFDPPALNGNFAYGEAYFYNYKPDFRDPKQTNAIPFTFYYNLETSQVYEDGNIGFQQYALPSTIDSNQISPAGIKVAKDEVADVIEMLMVQEGWKEKLLSPNAEKQAYLLSYPASRTDWLTTRLQVFTSLSLEPQKNRNLIAYFAEELETEISADKLQVNTEDQEIEVGPQIVIAQLIEDARAELKRVQTQEELQDQASQTTTSTSETSENKAPPPNALTLEQKKAEKSKRRKAFKLQQRKLDQKRRKMKDEATETEPALVLPPKVSQEVASVYKGQPKKAGAFRKLVNKIIQAIPQVAGVDETTRGSHHNIRLKRKEGSTAFTISPSHSGRSKDLLGVQSHQRKILDKLLEKNKDV